MNNIFRQALNKLPIKQLNPEFLCTCFVAQTGELAMNAALLAFSLRETHGANLQLLAGIPNKEANCGSLTKDEMLLFESLDVQTIEIRNPIVSYYKVANKLGCMEKALEVTNRPYLAFLDSDIICFNNISIPSVEPWEVALKPTDVAKWGKNKRVWKKLYEACNTKVPREYVQATVTKEHMLPYYNSGFILVKTEKAKNLGKKWIECSQQCYDLAQKNNSEIIIGAKSSISSSKRIINLDQFSLPIAIQNLNLRTCILDERWNFPLNYRSSIPDNTMLVHYHNAESFFSVPIMRELWFYACHKYPKFLDLAKNMEKKDENNSLRNLNRYPVQNSKLKHHAFARDDGKGIPPGRKKLEAPEAITKIRKLLRRNTLLYNLYLKIKSRDV